MSLKKIVLRRIEDQKDVMGRQYKQWSIVIGDNQGETIINEDMKLVIDTLNILIDKVSK